MNALRLGLCVSISAHAIVFGALSLSKNARRSEAVPIGDQSELLTLVAAPTEVVAEKPEAKPVVAPTPTPAPPPEPPVVKPPEPLPVETPVLEPEPPPLPTAKTVEPKPEAIATADTPPPVAHPVSEPAATPPAQILPPPNTDSAPSGADLATQQATAGMRASPDYLKNPKPVYPALAIRRRQEGLVLLRVSVSVSGQAARVELSHTSGFPLLDTAALEAVKTWKFEPARIDSQPYESEIQVPIRFRLSN